MRCPRYKGYQAALRHVAELTPVLSPAGRRLPFSFPFLTYTSVCEKGFIMAVVKCVIRIRSTSLWQYETCFVEQLPMNSGPLAVLYCSSKHSHHTTHHTLSAGAAAVVSQTDSPVQLLCLIQHTALTVCGFPSVTPFVHEEGEGHCTTGYSVEVL